MRGEFASASEARELRDETRRAAPPREPSRSDFLDNPTRWLRLATEDEDEDDEDTERAASLRRDDALLAADAARKDVGASSFSLFILVCEE